MKKNFSVGLLILCITFLLSGCGNYEADYIKEHSKELKKALGDYTFEKKEKEEDFALDGTHFWTTEYLEWLITYTTPDGSNQTFTLNNRSNIRSFYKQITDECIRNIIPEVEGIAAEVGWTKGIIVKIEVDEAEKDEEFMLYPAYTDLKTLVSEYDCTIVIGVNYNLDVNKCKKTIAKLIKYCNNEVNIRVYCDMLSRGDIDPFEDERFVDIYVYEKGKNVLENFPPF